MPPIRLRLRHVLIWAVVIGVGTVALFDLNYITGGYLTWWGGLVYKSLISLGAVIAIFLALNYIRHDEGVQPTLPRGLVYGILIGALAGIIIGTHDVVFFRSVDPHYTARLLDNEARRQQAHRARLAAVKPRPDYLLEQTDKALTAIADARREAAIVEADPGRILIKNVANQIFFCAISALIMAIILRNIPLESAPMPTQPTPAAEGV